MDLTFQVPMQYSSLQHWILFSSPEISIPECHFHLDTAASSFLELWVIALCFSPVAYWTPSDLRGASSGVIYFFLIMLLMGLSQQEYWSGLPFPLPLDHVLSELSTMTHLSWVVLYVVTRSFIELHITTRLVHAGVNGISTCQKRLQRAPPPLHHMKAQQEGLAMNQAPSLQNCEP